MWKIFRTDPLAKADRRRTRAEKKHIRARERAWRRKRRNEAWQSFRKRFNTFIADPFSKRKRAERRQLQASERAWRRRRQAKAWRDFLNHFKKFIADPFAKRELSSEEKEKKRFKKYARRERILDRQKWWAKFRKNPWQTVFPPRQLRMPGGGYHYAFQLSKKERKEIARRKRKQFHENFRKLIAIPDLLSKLGFSYLHSTAYFILAFMLIYIIYQGVTILVASSYNIPVVWYYYRLKFPLDNYSPLYTREALVVIFAMGPILSLMLAFVFLKLYFSTNIIVKRFKLFFLWGFICGANMFFGAYIAGVITQTEFIYTSAWLFMSPRYATEEIIFSVIALATMIIIGRIVTPLFLLSSGSVTIVKPEFRFYFVLSQVILPWVTGMIILFLITLPNSYIPLILKTITPGLILIPSLFLYNSLQFENIHESGVIQRNYFRWSIVIVAIALLFFYRLLLSFGLSVS